MTKLALIPPVSLLDTAIGSDHQLALPHMLASNEEYLNWYRARGDAGDYIILDNGEAEGENRFKTHELIEMAVDIKADEVVAHDVMGDMEATKSATKQFLRDVPNIHGSAGLKIGIVAQGENRSEVIDFVDYFLEHHALEFDTIHLPRHLIGSLGPVGRISIAKALKQTYPSLFDAYDVHFLGAHYEAPAELLRLAHEMPEVRSMDTSMPYNYAYAGSGLTGGRHKRPEGYFELRREDFKDLNLVHENIRIMKRWVNG